tara:strand:- start:790 stop:1950 length:1161 start_codon:yes stop_codon:yes gene_type:complete
MKKKIIILGSTGSIGKTLINIIKENKKNFEIVLLTANKNYLSIIKQAKFFKVKNIIITDKKSYLKSLKINKNKELKIYNNFETISNFLPKKVDYTMSSIIGLNGLIPTLKIIKFTKEIAIANKESLICGWNLIKAQLKKNKTKFIPVDSEHFSIWYALKNNKDEIKRVYLTASGGPFINLPLNKFKKISIEHALKHPNWRMGKKITIDSATMMNKVFEVMEAKNIFNIDYDKIKILIHPKSYLHCVVQFQNGMSKIIAHDTNMKIPVFNTIYKDSSKYLKSNYLTIKILNNLSLMKVDYKKFPLVKLLHKLPKKNSLYETIIVSANDTIVKLFLDGKIQFTDISKKILKIINNKEFLKYKNIKAKKADDIIKLDDLVRLKIKLKSI